MPRNYARKTTRQNWNENAMINALAAVKEGMPYKTASKQFAIPLMALKRRVKGKNVYAVGATKVLGSLKKVFTEEQELELVQHIKDNEETMYGFTVDDVLKFAFEIAERNNIRHPFSTTSRKAGKDWLRGFRQRHPDITLRSPESTSAARARAFNKPVVSKFYDILQKVHEKHSFPPHRIFNVDETSLNTVPTKNTKNFAKKGRKQVARITSAERGESTTAVICGSAGGNFIPPMLIFRRLRMKIELMDGTPPGSVYACNPSGWMNIEVFSQWFDHFLSHSKPSTEDPILLILDGHLSHTRNLNVIIKARENNVTILCLPPHCTHKLQPLDVAVMFPLSIYHNQALERWMNNNPGRTVTVFQIGIIFGEAYFKAAIPINIIKGFGKCGIWPINPDIFTDIDFVAANTTEREIRNEMIEPSASTTVATDGIQVTSDLAHTTPILVLNTDASTCVPIEEPTYIQSTVSPSLLSTCVAYEQRENTASLVPAPYLSVAPETIQISDEGMININLTSEAEAPFIRAIPLQCTPAKIPFVSGNVSPSITSTSTETTRSPKSPRPSPTVFEKKIAPSHTATSQLALDRDSLFTSPIPSTSFTIPPSHIRPLPKMSEQRRKTNKTRVSTAVLTSTPYKTLLEEEINKKKNEKKAKKKHKDNQKLSKVNSKTLKEKVVSKRKIKEKGKLVEKGKGTKRTKYIFNESSSDDEDDAECLFCNEKFSTNTRGEGWIKCCVCLRWGHDACAGVDPEDADEFTCDFCADDRLAPVRKHLQL